MATTAAATATAAAAAAADVPEATAALTASGARGAASFIGGLYHPRHILVRPRSGAATSRPPQPHAALQSA
ncbi:unnamed protein product [Lampetra planeri]